MASPRYELLTPELTDKIAELSEEDQSYWLILEDHPDFQGFWRVESLWPQFHFDFEEMIGPYRAVSPAKLGEFLDRCEELEYKVAFLNDPTDILEAFKQLNEPPPFTINSDQEGTVNGFFPWQVQGYNFLRNEENRCGIARWDTGTGKSVLMGMLMQHHAMQDPSPDLQLIVVKKNNRIGMARKLRSLFGIEATVLTGKLEKRQSRMADLIGAIASGPQIAITNYEKFREDTDWWKTVFDDHDLVVYWDEMPTRLRTRGTKLYDAVGSTLYRSWPKPMWHRLRPKSIRQYEFTATPIENSPQDHFNCVRLMDPDLLGTTREFEAFYGLYRNPLSGEIDSWHRLNHFGHVTAHVTHDVDKTHPDVAKHFPKVIEEEVLIDWDEKDREVYDTVTGRVRTLFEGSLGEVNVLAMIGILRMLCNAPTMLLESAENYLIYLEDLEAFREQSEGWGREPSQKGSEAVTRLLKGLKRRLTDKRHTKLEQLRSDLTEDYADHKALVFTAFGPLLLPKLSNYLTDWGINHVVYQGTDKQRQQAIDNFEADSSVQVFLSSDAGSDSIELPSASLVIHYDEPFKWSTKIQRQNRAHRAISTHEHVRFRTYRMVDSYEERIGRIIATKAGFHDSIFRGIIQEQALSQKITREELLYALTGVSPESLA